MTHVASLLFCIICILIIAFDSFKARFEFWYPMLVILNLSIFVLISRNFSLFKKHNLLLSFILFPLVAFSGFIFWTYILNFIPLNIFGDPRGDTFHYFSLIAPGLIAAIGFFLAVSVPALPSNLSLPFPPSSVLFESLPLRRLYSSLPFKPEAFVPVRVQC